MTEMSKECAGKGTIFRPEKGLCDALEVCANVFLDVHEHRRGWKAVLEQGSNDNSDRSSDGGGSVANRKSNSTPLEFDGVNGTNDKDKMTTNEEL
jgi:hypothetical protein